MTERVFAILGVAARLAQFEADPLDLPSIAGRVICVPWLPRDDDDRDTPQTVEWHLQSSQHWRLAVAFDTDEDPTGTEEDDAQRVADALSAQIDLRHGGPPRDLFTVEIEQDRGAWRPTVLASPRASSHTRLVPDDTLLRSLDRLETLLSQAHLLQATGYWQASLDFFAYTPAEREEVLADRKTRPAANIDRARMEAAYHGAWKAIEALTSGEPNRDDRRFRERLLRVGIDPERQVAVFGDETPPATILDLLREIEEKRDKRAAHGGYSGGSRAITDFDLMTAQAVAQNLILETIDFEHTKP